MKKIILSFGLIVLLIVGMFSLGGCIKDSDESIAREKQDQLTNAIKNKDKDAIKALFASNKIAVIENLDESIEQLLAYFEGDYVSHTAGGPMVANSKDNGNIIKYYQMSCYISTTVREYRIALKWYITDTADSGNVGIWALYIFNENDDLNQELTYSPGIHVGMP